MMVFSKDTGAQMIPVVEEVLLLKYVTDFGCLPSLRLFWQTATHPLYRMECVGC